MRQLTIGQMQALLRVAEESARAAPDTVSDSLLLAADKLRENIKIKQLSSRDKRQRLEHVSER